MAKSHQPDKFMSCSRFTYNVAIGQVKAAASHNFGSSKRGVELVAIPPRPVTGGAIRGTAAEAA